jgi:hypothetical protein
MEHGCQAGCNFRIREKKKMKAWHVVGLLVIGYIIAIVFPGPGNAVKGKLMGAVGK